jgi:hypothetical protein
VSSLSLSLVNSKVVRFNLVLIKVVLLDCEISIEALSKSNNMEKIDFFGQIIDTINAVLSIGVEKLDERIV